MDINYILQSVTDIDPQLAYAACATIAMILIAVCVQRMKAASSRRPARGPCTPGAVRVVALWHYPVKGCKGIPLEACHVAAEGLERDREWAVVRTLAGPKPSGETATLITARAYPRLLALQPGFTESGNLALQAVEGGRPVGPQVEVAKVPARRQHTYTATLWKTTVTGADQGDAVARFLCQHLGGEGFRLVRMEQAGRELKASPSNGLLVADRDDVSKFSDWSTFTIASTKSLAWLNDHLERPVTMQRFRPNIVVDGAAGALQPFAEEAWGSLLVGQVAMRHTHPCGRCVMTTLRPEAGGAAEAGGEPLATLRRLRAGFHTHDPAREDRQAFFSINLVHDPAPGQVIRIGDPIEVKTYKETLPSSQHNFPYLLTGKDNPYN